MFLHTNTIDATQKVLKASEAANPVRQTYRILSIDGGGVRGVIPTRILQEIEQRTGKPICQLFDLVLGTSTGGIVTLALMTPDGEGNAKYKACDLVTFYRNETKKIFKRSLLHKIITGWNLWGPKYNRKTLDRILKRLFADSKLSQTLKPAIVPTYSLNTAKPHIWKTRTALKTQADDCYLRDIVGATCAAPTFFAAKSIKNKGKKVLYEIDGGICANNPADITIEEIRENNPYIKNEDILLVSIGTGRIDMPIKPQQLKNAGMIGWLIDANLADMITNADMRWAAELVKAVYPNSHRIQIELSEYQGKMDDASDQHLEYLLERTAQYIQEHDALLDALCKSLTKD